MANEVTITKLMDGPRNAVFHVFIKGDGASGELTDYVLVDPTVDFNPALAAKPIITLMELEYSFVGFDAFLEYEYLATDTPLWVLTRGQENEICFSEVGGLRDRSPVLDGSGKLKITTVGLSSGFGSLLIQIRKD